MGISSIWHWLIVLAIILLIFGTKKLRHIGHDLGGAIKGFKEGMKEDNGTPPAEQAATPLTSPPNAASAGQTIDVEAEGKKSS